MSNRRLMRLTRGLHKAAGRYRRLVREVGVDSPVALQAHERLSDARWHGVNQILNAVFSNRKRFMTPPRRMRKKLKNKKY